LKYDLESDVKKAQKGDKLAFTRLIKEYEIYLYKVSTSIMGSDQEGLDATQEALIKAYISLPSLNEPKYFKTWLTRILIRECTKLKRNQNKVVSIYGVKEKAGESHLREEHLDLKEAINSLEEEYRMVVLLYYIQDLPLKEVAVILEQPEGTIKSRLSRARKRLAELLEKNIPMGGMLHEKF
jgi:RNA polymerase sigma-70 factor, ECF subfamily